LLGSQAQANFAVAAAVAGAPQASSGKRTGWRQESGATYQNAAKSRVEAGMEVNPQTQQSSIWKWSARTADVHPAVKQIQDVRDMTAVRTSHTADRA
jgi:hypothetical protein